MELPIGMKRRKPWHPMDEQAFKDGRRLRAQTIPIKHQKRQDAIREEIEGTLYLDGPESTEGL